MKKVGIYTIHACNNYGAVLQAYATARFLNEHGHKAEIVNVVTETLERAMAYQRSWRRPQDIVFNLYVIFNPSVKRKIRNFSSFRGLLPLSQLYRSYQEVIDNPPSYDVHLVGSDQVWNVERGLGQAYFFLPFIPKGGRKMSYASSFGCYDAIRQNKESITNLLSSFDGLGVREQDAAAYLSQECGLIPQCVLDPTFLLDSQQWGNIAGDEPIIKTPYILYYGFDTNRFCEEALSLASRMLKLPVIGVSVSLHSPYKFDRFYQEAGPKEFLNLIKNATMVLTSSFHGMALSLNFRRDFVVIRSGTRMSRMESLLKLFDLDERIVGNTDELSQLLSKRPNIDYQTCSSVMEEKSLESGKWLLNQLDR